METKFNQDLAQRDQNLANRELEHSRKVDDINAKHDAEV